MAYAHNTRVEDAPSEYRILCKRLRDAIPGIGSIIRNRIRPKKNHTSGKNNWRWQVGPIEGHSVLITILTRISGPSTAQVFRILPENGLQTEQLHAALLTFWRQDHGLTDPEEAVEDEEAIDEPSSIEIYSITYDIYEDIRKSHGDSPIQQINGFIYAYGFSTPLTEEIRQQLINADLICLTDQGFVTTPYPTSMIGFLEDPKDDLQTADHDNLVAQTAIHLYNLECEQHVAQCEIEQATQEHNDCVGIINDMRKQIHQLQQELADYEAQQRASVEAIQRQKSRITEIGEHMKVIEASAAAYQQAADSLRTLIIPTT